MAGEKVPYCLEISRLIAIDENLRVDKARPGDKASRTTDDVHAEPRLAEQRGQAGSSKPVALLHQQQRAGGPGCPLMRP